MKKYYHISDLENKQSILLKGLNSDLEGNIYLYDDLSLTNDIALNQLGLFDFTVFEIVSNGIKDELVKDNVAEISADSQFICAQDKIEVTYIKFVEDRTINPHEAAIQMNTKTFSMIDNSFAQLNELGQLKYLCEALHYDVELQDYIKSKIKLL